jgi:hypothetical protein
MLKAETVQIEKTEHEARRNSPMKARIALTGGALAVVVLFSGCAGYTEWWRAQAQRQDAAARTAVSNDDM